MKYKVRLRKKLYEVEFEIIDPTADVTDGAAYIPAQTLAAQAPVPAPVAPPAPTPAAPAPAPAPISTGSETILAPLPGTILSIKVQKGDKVKKGQLLLILEAMKMENEVLSPKDGTVSQIMTQSGTAVSSGSPLLVLE